MRANDLVSFLSILFDKHHVPPRGCPEMACVVVRISGPNEAVVRNVVPFFARDLARLAADAHGWIREETDLHIFPYVIVPALVRALCAFADHKGTRASSLRRRFPLIRNGRIRRLTSARASIAARKLTMQM